MKKLLIVFALIGVILLCGCNVLDVIFPPDDPVPEPEPVVVMEAEVNAVLVFPTIADDIFKVAWSIENVGELFIYEYEIAFDVTYPNVTVKDNVFFTVTGKHLEVDEKREGIYDLVPYDTPETVSVECELFSIE